MWREGGREDWFSLIYVIMLFSATFITSELMERFPFSWKIYLSMALAFGRLFSFVILYTVGRTPWKGDQHDGRPLPTHRTTETQNKRKRHPCLEWYSNPRCQRSSERRHFMLASSLQIMKRLLLIHVGRIIFAFLFPTLKFVLKKFQEKIDTGREVWKGKCKVGNTSRKI
jgi:phosphotransferase system  glucose/maltose/N-acetylglucosamine-specific IIC component